MILVGLVFLTFEVVLRVFVVVCALFATTVMVGLMIEWAQALFNKKQQLQRVA